MNALLLTQDIDWAQLESEIMGDEWLQQIKREVEQQTREHKGFTVVEGKLFYKNRYVIPKNSSLIPVLLHHYHDSTAIRRGR